MIVKCISFCVDELLWMIAWGWSQLALSIFLTWFLFIIFTRLRSILAAILTIGSYAFAIGLYSLLVAGFFIDYLQRNLVASSLSHVYAPFHASLALGIIYSALQAAFYFLINCVYRIPVTRLFLLSFISNIVAAILASYFIKITL